jgi:hypothetical protein
MQFCAYSISDYCSDNDVTLYKLIMFIKSMQSAFVLCRLFKKQDETIEGSNCGEPYPAVSSPTTAKSSPEITQPELALDPISPSFGGQAENCPTSTDVCLAESSDGTTADTPVNWNCDSHVAENEVAELPEPKVRRKLSCSLQ